MSGMRWFRRYFDSSFKAARQRALAHIRGQSPTFTVTTAQLCAEEPSRWVFAVFYREPGVLVVPGRYRLVAVARQGDAVEALETSPQSPYWRRGLK